MNILYKIAEFFGFRSPLDGDRFALTMKGEVMVHLLRDYPSPETALPRGAISRIAHEYGYHTDGKHGKP